VARRPTHPIEFRPARAGEVDRNFANYDRARREIGFEPQTDFETAVAKTWEWFDQRRRSRPRIGMSG
jgi:UDP-glucose 4-epimerase